MTGDARRVSERGPECLADEQIHSMATGTVKPREHASLQAHLDLCPLCLAEVKLYRDFLAGDPTEAEAEDVKWIVRDLERRSPASMPEPGRVAVVPMPVPTRRQRGSRWSSKAVWALAAAAVLVLSIGLPILMEREPGLRGLRESGEILRSGRFAVSQPVGDIGDKIVRFEWEPVTGATRYVLTIMEVDRAVLWTGEVEEASIPAPDEVNTAAIPGKTLLWEVRAYDTAGDLLAMSETGRFRLVPK